MNRTRAVSAQTLSRTAPYITMRPLRPGRYLVEAFAGRGTPLERREVLVEAGKVTDLLIRRSG